MGDFNKEVVFWFRFWLMIGLCLSASASADSVIRFPAKFHSSEYRLVFPQFPPIGFTESDSVKLRMSFEKQFPLGQFKLAFNGWSAFSNSALRSQAKWVEGSKDSAVLEVDLYFLFKSGKSSFHRYVRHCMSRNGRLEIWWRAPIRLIKGDLLWTKGGALTVIPFPPEVVVDQRIADEPWTWGDAVALRFHAEPFAESFECSLDNNAFALCESPLAYHRLKGGRHAIRIRAHAGKVVGPVFRYQFVAFGYHSPIVLKAAVPAGAVIAGHSLVLTFEDRLIRQKKRQLTCQLDGQPRFLCESPVVLVNLMEGGHVLSIENLKENFFETPFIYSFRVESSPPVLTVTQTPQVITSHDTATFAFASDRPGTFWCSLDDENSHLCTSPFNRTQLIEGEHKVEIRAIDESNRTSDLYSYRWVVDTVAPQFSLTANPAAKLLKLGSLQLSFVALEPIRTVTCSLDGNALPLCQSPLALTLVANGSHHFVLSASDTAGNLGGFSYDFKVDSQSPVVELRRIANGVESNPNDASFEFLATEAVQFSCAVDGKGFGQCVSPVIYRGLTNGSHHLAVVAQDPAGNTTEAEASWNVDLVGPTLTIVSFTPAQAVTESQSFSAAISSNEPASLFYQLDGGAELPFGSPLVINDLIEGTHRIHFRGVDPVGNISDALLYSWVVALPAVVAITEVANSSPVTTLQENSFTFQGTHAIEFRCALDGAAFSTCLSPLKVSALSDGLHTFSVRGVNLAGIEGAMVNYSWRVEAPPAIVALTSSVSDGSATTAQMALFVFSSNGTSFECALDNGAFVPCTSPFTAAGLSDGAHQFRVFARNAREMAGPQALVGWTVATPAAVVTLGVAAPAQLLTNNPTMTLSFTATNAGQVFCSLDHQPPVVCQGSVSYTGLSSADHFISIYGVSLGGTVGALAQYHWTVDTIAPLVIIDSVTPSTSPTSNTFLTVQFHSDDGAAIARCGLDGNTPVPCVSPWVSSVTTDGPHAIAMWETDLAGNESPVPATYQWVVDRSFLCSSFTVGSVTATSAVLTWNTNLPSSSLGHYGPGSNRGQTAMGASNVLVHSVMVTGLARGTFYSAMGESSPGDARTCQTSPLFFSTPP